MKSGRMDERDLIQNCRGGDRESCRKLMERYSDYAMSVAFHILMNRQDAEDACQDAFFKAFHHLGSFDPERSFKPWFSSLLVRQCLDQVRKRVRFGRFLDRLKSDPPAPLLSSGRNAAEDTAPIGDLLGGLRPKERAALYLWSQEGYTGEEIGAALNCSPKTAHVHLYRARVKLKSRLKESNHGKV
jgi:RNA polymerase sigma-70 factor (ECF subfamily)